MLAGRTLIIKMGNLWRYSSHQLGWEPGQHGKGLVDEDGNVHTWTTPHGPDMPPNHPQYVADAFGLSDKQWMFSPMWNRAFQINPEGHVNVYEDDESADSKHLHQNADNVRSVIQQADPRLRVVPKTQFRWNFSRRLTWHTGADMPGHPEQQNNGWSSGEWGRGLYFPETGELITWSDGTDMTHTDILNSDQFAGHEISTHLLIQPDGTVIPQGTFDRNFEDQEQDIEGLAQALKRYNPQLRLSGESTEPWSFNTEPMPEWPDNSDHGWMGGTEHHDVQFRDDFQGA